METFPRSPSDEALAVRGDLVSLHERYAQRLLDYVARRIASDMDLDDLAQEVWTRVWKQMRKKRGFDGPGHFRNSLFRIAANLITDGYRNPRRKFAELRDNDVRAANTPGPVDILEQEEENQILQQCLEKLPPDQAKVMRMRLGGEKPEAIAQAMNLALTVVYRLTFQGRAAMTQCVGERAS